jgi:hypothetical protein
MGKDDFFVNVVTLSYTDLKYVCDRGTMYPFTILKTSFKVTRFPFRHDIVIDGTYFRV